MQTVTTIDTSAIIRALAGAIRECDALDEPMQATVEGQRAVASRTALETLLVVAQPRTPAEALALLSMSLMQVSRIITGTAGEANRSIAFKAQTGLAAALKVLAPALGHGVNADVLTLLERYTAKPLPVLPVAV